MQGSRNKFFIILIGGVILYAAIILFFGVPIYRIIIVSHESLLGAKQELAVLNKKERLLRDLEHTIVDIGPDIEKSDNAFFTSGKVVPFIESIEQAADIAHVTHRINSAALDAVSSGKPAARFDITAQGTSLEVRRFIVLLASLPYNSELAQVTVTTAGTNPSGGEPRVQAVIALQALIREEQ